jgi:hypothetical protein
MRMLRDPRLLFLGVGAKAGLGPAPVELWVKGEGKRVVDGMGVVTTNDSDGTGETSREIGDLNKSWVRTSSIGFKPSRG